MTVGQLQHLRLFIEGVEVPVIAAQVQCTPNAPAVASIQIPPSEEATKLFPRSLIHLFFLDPGETSSPFPTGGATDAATQSPSDGQNVTTIDEVTVEGLGSVDRHNTKYKLLFGGEMVGWQYTKNEGNRSIVLQCMDWSNYWDYAYQWNNTDLFGPGVKALFSGGSTNLFTDFLEDEGSAIIRIIQTPSVQFPNLKGLLGGIVHLLEAIGGSYFGPKKFAGENIFFSIAELRLHITQMITAYEKDPTASRLLNAGYDSLFGRMLGGLGQQVSIRQAINSLMSAIFHETYAQPCPRFVPGTGNTPSGKTRRSARSDPNNAYIAVIADQLILSIDSLTEVLQDIAQNPTSGPSTMLDFTARMSEMKSTCRDVANRIKGKDVQSARAYYSSSAKYIDTAIAKAKQYKPSTASQAARGAMENLAKARQQLESAQGFEIVTTEKGATPARLNQQVFRPDVWFSAPPRCNVLFPEHYFSLTYQRMFLAEPTRLLLKTNDEFFGEDELFDQFYFAPKGFTLKSGRRELQNILANDILDHELFTGILPVFEKMGELNIFAARSGAVNGKMPKIGLAQRSANFLYFKYRFAARQMSISGKFNPYVAPGFPGLIIDKYVSRDVLALHNQLSQKNGGAAGPDINRLLGTHFLANFTEVVHSVDNKGGGSTQYSCSYARDTNEGIEFLGVLREDQTVQRRQDKDAQRVTVVASLFPPSTNALGPNLGNIIAIADVTDAYTTGTTDGTKLPLFAGPNRAGTKQARISVPVGVVATAEEYGEDVVRLLGGNRTQVVQFRAYRLTEEVPRYRQEKVDLPAEEYIRPGWYGDIWHPSQIGLAYQEFFETGAITDETTIPLGKGQEALDEASSATDADDPAAAAPGMLALDKNASISDACAFLVTLYSHVRSEGLDIEDFIRNYTWRPIATMVDMFGTSDLALDFEGKLVVSGVEGFHSRAFGPYDDLFGLVTQDIENIVGIKKNSTAAMRGDTRLRKQKAVLDYVAGLQFARAILG